MCRSGNSPAQATANSVIASANRLIEVRHSCFSSSRIAEISVPAWPMPIHQTKLTIANPHMTGTLMPQMPDAHVEQVRRRAMQEHDEQRRADAHADDPSPVVRAQSAPAS